MEIDFVIEPDDDGAVRVAEYNLGSHLYQVVDKKQAALEHFLVNQHTARALHCRYEHHAEEVRRYARPWGIGDGQHGAVERLFDSIAVLGRDVEVVALLHHVYAKTAERFGDDAEITYGDISDSQAAARNRRHGYEAADFNHVGQHGMVRAVEQPSACAVDRDKVAADAVNSHSHALQQSAQLLEVGFAGCIIYSGVAMCQGSSHDDVGGAGHTGFVK